MRFWPQDFGEWVLAVLIALIVLFLILMVVWTAGAPTCEEQGGKKVQGAPIYVMVGKVMVPMPTEDCDK